MKFRKFILIILVFVSAASCSSDDEGVSNSPGNDKIVGKWKVQKELMDGEEVPLTDCEKQTTIEFLANGNLNSTEFFEDPETENCVSEVNNEQWENRGGDVYRIIDGDEFVDIPIIFTSNNNTFTITAEDEDVSYSRSFVRM